MMAVYDLEEQEQIDEIKAWWKQYRSLVLLVVVAAAVTLGGIQAWRYHQSRQALEAGELYSQLQGAVGSGEQKKVQDIAAALVEKYPRTGYATFAALAGAKAAFDSGDAAGARTRLQWVVENGRDDETRDIARLRLAAVLLDEKQYDAALKLLEARQVDALSALYADLKGDVLVAQGRSNDARSAYQLALDKSDARSAHRALIQIKLDALGEAK
jgi:predicted negative regulator of RcsB-dependent stress response